MTMDSDSLFEIPILTKEGIDRTETRGLVKEVLSALNFTWQGKEEGGFANEQVVRRQIGEYLSGEGNNLALSTEEIWSEVMSADDLVKRVFGELHFSDSLSSEADAYFPYHGLGHAWNTLISGIKIFLPRLKEIAQKRQMGKEEQSYWIKVVTKALALHELDDWWAKAEPNGEKMKEVKRMVAETLYEEGISIVNFNDIIRLDHYVNDVPTQIEAVRAKPVDFLPRRDDETQTERMVENDYEMAKAIGESIVGADFMQTFNPEYREKCRVKIGDEIVEVPRGSLALVMEMFLIAPERVPSEWRKAKGDGWEVNYKALGPNYDFMRKIIRKIRPVWGDLGRFSKSERANAYQALLVLFRDVQMRARSLHKEEGK